MPEAARLAAQPWLRWTSLPLWLAIWVVACAGTFAAVLLLDHWLALAVRRWIAPSRYITLLIPVVMLLQGAVVWFWSPENAGKELDGIHV